jgi:hypothetical protein
MSRATVLLQGISTTNYREAAVTREVPIKSIQALLLRANPRPKMYSGNARQKLPIPLLHELRNRFVSLRQRPLIGQKHNAKMLRPRLLSKA